jgi:hypothetical protein
VPAQIFKLLIFLKRRPDMSLEAFRDYYENVHAKLGEKYAVGVRRYVRRYVQHLVPAPTEPPDEMSFDVITELWYDDRAVFEKVAEFAPRGVLPADVLADEERLFDRSKTRYATVIELDSPL